MTATEIIDSNNKKSTRIDRLSGAYYVVPPTHALSIVRVRSCDVMIAG